MTIKGAVLTEKPYKLRETNDEWRGMNDEWRMTRDKWLSGKEGGGMVGTVAVGAVGVTNNDLEIWRFGDYCYFCGENLKPKTWNLKPNT